MIMRIFQPAALGIALIAAFALVAPAPPGHAQVEAGDGIDFDTYVAQLAARARAEGVSAATVRRMTTGLSPDPRVIRLDRGQPGSPTRRGYPALGHGSCRE